MRHARPQKQWTLRKVRKAIDNEKAIATAGLIEGFCAIVVGLLIWEMVMSLICVVGGCIILGLAWWSDLHRRELEEVQQRLEARQRRWHDER